MADDNPDHTDAEDMEDAVTPETEQPAEGTEESADATDEQADDEHEGEATLPHRLTLSPRNASVIGQLFVSYPTRDVVIPMDGDAGMRILSAFERRSDRGLGDYLDPRRSSALDAWVVLDAIEQPMAMTWVPGLPGKTPRMAVDPAVAD